MVRIRHTLISQGDVEAARFANKCVRGGGFACACAPRRCGGVGARGVRCALTLYTRSLYVQHLAGVSARAR